jgi:hypothetical protein
VIKTRITRIEIKLANLVEMRIESPKMRVLGFMPRRQATTLGDSLLTNTPPL